MNYIKGCLGRVLLVYLPFLSFASSVNVFVLQHTFIVVVDGRGWSLWVHYTVAMLLVSKVSCKCKIKLPKLVIYQNVNNKVLCPKFCSIFFLIRCYRFITNL